MPDLKAEVRNRISDMLESLEERSEDLNKQEKMLDRQEAMVDAQVDDLKEMREIFDKYIGDPPNDVGELEELFSVLCFGSLGFCCGLEKSCFKRNTVLRILGIRPKEYDRMKREFGKNLASRRG